MPTYPSPKLTLTLTSHLGQNVRGGVGEQFLRDQKCYRLFYSGYNPPGYKLPRYKLF